MGLEVEVEERFFFEFEFGLSGKDCSLCKLEFILRFDLPDAYRDRYAPSLLILHFSLTYLVLVPEPLSVGALVSLSSKDQLLR